jgi:hypothetical protein
MFIIKRGSEPGLAVVYSIQQPNINGSIDHYRIVEVIFIAILWVGVAVSVIAIIVSADNPVTVEIG